MPGFTLEGLSLKDSGAGGREHAGQVGMSLREFCGAAVLQQTMVPVLGLAGAAGTVGLQGWLPSGRLTSKDLQAPRPGSNVLPASPVRECACCLGHLGASQTCSLFRTLWTRAVPLRSNTVSKAEYPSPPLCAGQEVNSSSHGGYPWDSGTVSSLSSRTRILTPISFHWRSPRVWTCRRTPVASAFLRCMRLDVRSVRLGCLRRRTKVT